MAATALKPTEDDALAALRGAIACRCEPEVGIDEAEMADYYAGLMRDFGIEVETFEVEPGRPNVVGRIPGSAGGRSLALAAHLMAPYSIAEDWDTPPYEMVVRDGRIIGSGVADVKAGIVAMLFAARELAAEGTDGDVIIALGAGGELGGLIGTKAIVERGPLPDAVVVCEPTDLNYWHRERGAIFMELVVRGETGLSGGGDNANHKALEVAHALRELDAAIQGRAAAAPADVGTGALSINLIDGGTYYYNVPDRCRLLVDRRLGLEEDADEALAEIVGVVDGFRKGDDDPSLSALVELVIPPIEVSTTGLLGETLSSVITDIRGEAPRALGVRGFTEMAHWALAGVEALVCGPGSIHHIHKPNEWLPMDEFVDTIAIYRDLGRRFTAART